jgi:CTD small phosphatase-like protein 2
MDETLMHCVDDIDT